MQPEKIVALDAPMPFCDSAKALVSKFAVAFVDHPRDAIALVGILVGDAHLFFGGVVARCTRGDELKFTTGRRHAVGS